MASVVLDTVVRCVGDTTIVDGLSLHVRDRELMVLVGRSGSGKTSVLRAVAGLDDLNSGRVWFGDEDVTSKPTNRRDIGMLFESNTLFGNLSVQDNVGLPLRFRSIPKNEIDARVSADVRALGIDQLIKRAPNTLSGGEQHLVQIARTMVRRPAVFLFDEPLSPLDAASSRRLRRELRVLQTGYGVTTLCATNDSEMALAIGDRLAVIADGRIQQVGTPATVHDDPNSLTSAVLTGELGTLSIKVVREAAGFALVGDDINITARSDALRSVAGSHVTIGIRPDCIVPDNAGQVRATVGKSSFRAGRQVRLLSMGGLEIATSALDLPEGESIGIRFARYHVFDHQGLLLITVE